MGYVVVGLLSLAAVVGALALAAWDWQVQSARGWP